MTKKIVGQWAVWQYDRYPWFLTGEVGGFDRDCYFVKGYGRFKKTCCMLISNEQGRKLKEDHNDLWTTYQTVMEGVRKGMNSVLCERVRKIDPAILNILPPKPAGRKL